MAHASSKPLLEVPGLAAGYGGSTVLAGLDMTVHEGESVALLGRNGVGKSTTLKAITGSLPLGAGALSFDGKPLAGLKPYEINRLGISLVRKAPPVPEPHRHREPAARHAPRRLLD
jgi:ABC-type branched-subunit amino acid transport system ATPase component